MNTLPCCMSKAATGVCHGGRHDAEDRHTTTQYGMTLRDYFAGQALAGWMATFTDDTDGSDVNADGVARLAYRVADAMLKARGG